MGFELKHFTPEQLKKLSVLNPNLAQDLGLETVDEAALTAELIEVGRQNAETWIKLEAAYKANTEATQALEKARKGTPLASPVQLLGIVIFLVILIRIIGGG